MAVPPPLARSVVVVDDDVDAAKSLKRVLDDWGFVVMTAHNGFAGAEVVLERTPAVVVSDIDMPGTDGIKGARLIRSMRLAVQPWLIALTGATDNSTRLAALAAGFDHYLNKPPRLSELVWLLEQCVRVPRQAA